MIEHLILKSCFLFLFNFYIRKIKKRTENISNIYFFLLIQPNRTYYLEDPEGFALEWCRAIEETRVHCYGLQEMTTT